VTAPPAELATGPLDDFTHRVLWLGRVRVGIQRLLLARGRSGEGGIPDGPPRFRDELGHLLTGVPAAGEETLRAVDREIASYDAVLRDRIAETRAARGTAPLDALRDLGLTHEEECLLWCVAAPQVDPSSTRLFRMTGALAPAGVQLDFAIAAALGHRHSELDGALGLLGPDRPLARMRLLVGGRDGARGLELLDTARVHPDVAARMVGVAGPLPASLGGLVELVTPPRELVLPAAVVERARAAYGAGTEAGAARVFMVGQAGSGRRSLAASLAQAEGRTCWAVDAGRLEPRASQGTLRDLVREARLAGAALHVRDADLWLARGAADPAFVAVLEDLLTDHALPVTLDAVAAPTLVTGLAQGGPLRFVELPPPDEDDRRRLWRMHLPAKVGDRAIADLARRYVVTGGQIARAAERVASQSPGDEPLPMSELTRHARAEQTSELSKLCQRVEHTMSWDDLVVADGVRAQLRDVLDFARMRQRIFDDWGFHRKIAYGRGMAVLLSGPPGTGKTMIAGVLAGDLGLDLYQVDVSQVVS
jgi:hypothetical protein